MFGEQRQVHYPSGAALYWAEEMLRRAMFLVRLTQQYTKVLIISRSLLQTGSHGIKTSMW